MQLLNRIKNRIRSKILGESAIGTPIQSMKWTTHVVDPPVKPEINNWYNEISNQVMQLKNNQI